MTISPAAGYHACAHTGADVVLNTSLYVFSAGDLALWPHWQIHVCYREATHGSWQ